MRVNYDKLWKILIDKKIKKTELRDMAGISNGTLARLSKGEPVSMDALYRICRVLGCNLGDIAMFEEDVADV